MITIINYLFGKLGERRIAMALVKAKQGQTMTIKNVSGSEKIKKFLFTLGCYEGEMVTLIAVLAGNYIIRIKDSRYAIDKNMASAIELA